MTSESVCRLAQLIFDEEMKLIQDFIEFTLLTVVISIISKRKTEAQTQQSHDN
jgi:hypothetical protein